MVSNTKISKICTKIQIFKKSKISKMQKSTIFLKNTTFGYKRQMPLRNHILNNSDTQRQNLIQKNA
jgi:hypothetical protein